MEIKTDDYSVEYEPTTATVNFQGLLRLPGIPDYEPIIQLLNDVTEQEPPTITMNVLELKFLNSSGMSVLSRFVIGVRKKKTIGLVIKGSQGISWQQKSLNNWQRLMPALTLEWE
ncbi:MAG TPA: hypothetical protein V6D14_09775 [Coleofasciculaceae cyanobacterium]|jgi:hypothetical protein